MHVNSDKFQKFRNQEILIGLVAMLAIFGTFMQIISGIADSITHIQQAIDEWWRPSHIGVYSGVAMVLGSAILGSKILIKKSSNSTVRIGIKIIIICSILQILSGNLDYISHQIFGIDGYVSASHILLEFPLVFSAFAGFIMLNQVKNTKMRKLIPVSVLFFLFSILAVSVNFIMLFAGQIICIQVYKIFSYGCAIL